LFVLDRRDYSDRVMGKNTWKHCTQPVLTLKTIPHPEQAAEQNHASLQTNSSFLIPLKDLRAQNLKLSPT
jgi:hypothetical protein